jgi:hypothetical protein
LIIENKAILISGLPPGNSGTGRLIESIRERFSDLFEFIHLGGPFDQNIRKSIANIVNCKILLIHPQSIGFNLFNKIVTRNTCYLYVLDNSFFCGASYNLVKGEHQPCFRCFKDKTFEEKYKCENKWKFYDFHKISKNITFYSQNKNQKKLLIKKFGINTKVDVIGLNVSDIQNNSNELTNKESFDIVYHASNHFAKGHDFAKELSILIGERKIYFPQKGENWQNGLKEKIKNAKIVLNPSLWSAPVEGALLKSINYNGCVAVCSVQDSFIEELPDDIVLKLDPNDIKGSSKLLQQLLIRKEKRQLMIKESKKWLSSFLNDSKHTIEKHFSLSFERSNMNSIYKKDDFILKQENFFFCQITIDNLSNLKNYIVFALSSLTKHLIDIKRINPIFIIDTCKNLHGEFYKGIEILSPTSNRLNEYENILIISNHKVSIYKYIKSKDIFKSKKINWL